MLTLKKLSPHCQRSCRYRFALPLALVVVLLCASSAPAFPAVGEPGEGAGQISNPRGVAVDDETGRLYVADSGNNRVDVFDADTGAFEMAFGWGVKDGTPALQKCGPAATPPTCRKGLAGGGAGQFRRTVDIAVDNDPSSLSYQDVYVYDGGGSARVEKFDSEGNFLLAFGASGKGNCQFAPEKDDLHRLAVGPGGTVYVADTVFLGPFEHEGFIDRAEKFEPSGACLGEIKVVEVPEGEVDNGGASLDGLAVDSAGNLYASFPTPVGSQVHKYSPAGSLVGAVGAPISGGALAVDSADNLFIGTGRTIEEFDASGAEVRAFGYGALASGSFGIATYHSASGDVFVAERDEQGVAGTLYLPIPPAGPVVLPEPELTRASPIGNTSAQLNARINPEGKATKYHFEYISEAAFQANLSGGHEGFEGAIRAPANASEDATAGSDFESHGSSATVGCTEPTAQLVSEGKCLEPETQYRYRAFAENSDGAGNSPVEGTPFTTKQPIEIGESWSSDVESESAVLNAEVNPLGIPATGHFQYIAEGPDFQANGFLHAAETAVVDFGSAQSLTAGSAPVGLLQPNTLYHYRLVAEDFFRSESGPELTLRTPLLGPAGLPDGRVYEKVSPAAKDGGEVGVPTAAGGGAEKSVQPQQASPDGKSISYASFTAFGPEPESSPGASQYLSMHGPEAWTTLNINPRFEEGYTRDPFVGFSSDLSHAAVLAIEPSLTEDASDFPNLYVRNNDTGVLTAITTKDHEPTISVPKREYCISYGGASKAFDHVVFSAMGALNPGDPVAEGFNLYEWSPAAGVQLVSRFPGNAPAPARIGTGFGARTGEKFCVPAAKLMRHAVSEDGSRIFWTFEGTFEGATNPLFARVDGAIGKETIRIDKPNEGVAGAGGGVYWDASTDGERVFLTSTQKLTTTAAPNGGSDLYLYDFARPLKNRLLDLSVNANNPGEPAGVQGVVAASADGSYVYFVATGALTASPNSEGDVAVVGQENLYVWHEGEIRFIATLAAIDVSDWSNNPRSQSAEVTADGRHLAFLSTSSLTEYDNVVAGSSHCRLHTLGEADLVDSPRCPEVFAYDFAGDGIACISCNPSEARPLGPARLPSWSTPYEQPRYLSADGNRLFFDTLDALDPHDTNGKRDVYEFERQGSGSCNSASPTFAARSGGCIYLISSGEPSGESTDESYLLDASASGDSVFFSTRQSLLFTDKDQRFDVYDARVGGHLPPPEPVNCEGSCPDGRTGPEATPLPGTSAFEAPPEKASVECPKGTRKVHRKGKERCVKVNKKKHKAKQRRTATAKQGTR